MATLDPMDLPEIGNWLHVCASEPHCHSDFSSTSATNIQDLDCATISRQKMEDSSCIVPTRLSPFRVKFKYCLFWWPSFSEVLGVNSACCEEHAVFFPIKNGQFVAEIHLSLFLTPRRHFSDYLRFGFAGLTEGDAPPRLSWMRAIRMLFIYV